MESWLALGLFSRHAVHPSIHLLSQHAFKKERNKGRKKERTLTGMKTGYIGRVLMHSNPWSDSGFKMDLVCIILAPTLICAGIYLTLKHVARTVGPNFSRIKPRLYTWIFIPFDIFCLCLQAIGGGVDAAASDTTPVNEKTLKAGNDIIIAGIVLQVVNLAVFGLLSLDFFVAAKKHFNHTSSTEFVQNSSAARIWYSKRFRIFCLAVTGAYAGILIRCIYRFVFSSLSLSLFVLSRQY